MNRLKICGLMNRADVELCVELGIGRLGMVTEFPVPVPWNITADEAALLRQSIPDSLEAVVVTGGPKEHILYVAEKVKPNLIQLNIKDSLDNIRQLCKELKAMGIGVIAKYPTSDQDKKDFFHTDDVELITKELCNLGAVEILIDPRNPSNAEQKKLQADTSLVKKVKEIADIPVILAGGITPDNVYEKLKESNADSVDVMNGSETAPGCKSKEMIEELMRQVSMCK